MTWATFMTSLASVMALLSSIGACIVAVHSLRQSRSSLSAKLSERLTELESITEELSGAIKKLRQAQNMRAYRERQLSAPPSTPNPDEQRAATLRALQPLVRGTTNAK